MKAKLLVILFLLLSFYQMAGQNDQIISISFHNTPLKEAILQLEEQTKTTFFFKETWLNNQIITKTFNQQNLRHVLDGILENTTINYFIKGESVILLNNTIVYPELPPGYFYNDELGGQTDQASQKAEENQARSAPIFQEQFASPAAAQKRSIITIGKQNPNSQKTSFTLSGHITNQVTSEPIQNLSLSITNGSKYTITDENGYYSIELPQGINKLETNLMGFRKIYQTVIIYGNGTFNFEIAENVEALEEVVVESNRDANVKAATVGAVVINSESIKTIPLVLGERDLLKVATTLPGIKTVGEGSSGLNVRGGRADQNLFILDDAVVFNPVHFLGLFSAINPFTTQNLEIYKASIPAEFGGRLSSVFDIETKSGNTENLSGEGSIGPITANLALEIPVVVNKSSLVAGVRATYADYILRSLDDEQLKNSEASFYDAILKYSHDINEKNSVAATLYYSKDKFSITSDSLFGYSNRLASVKWSHTFSQKSRATLIFGSTQYKYDIAYEADANTNFDFRYVLNDNQFKLNLDNKLNDQHKLSYGLSSKLYVTDPGTVKPVGDSSEVEEKSVQREKGLESALYATDLFNVSDKLLLDIGLRYSFYAALGKSTQKVYQEGEPKSENSVKEIRSYTNNEIIKTYGGLEYRISGRYLLGNDLSLKAGFNRTIQYLHLLTTNTTQSPTDIWKLSDLNIAPQRADNFSVGLFKNYGENDFEISIESYYKKMNDLLDYKIGAQLILNDNLETELLQGEGKAYGVELLVKKNKGRLVGYVGYTYSRALIKLDGEIEEEQVNNGDYFSANFDKPHDFSFVGNYRFNKRISASVNVTYQTGRPITYPIGKFVFANEDQVVYSDRNKYRIPDYYRLDLGMNIEGNHKKKKLAHSFVNISVYNVLGRNNPYSVFFVNKNGGIKAYQTSIFSIPIPTITYNFKF